MGEVIRKFSKNQVMEIYGSVSFQSSVSTYRSLTFQSSVELVMEIYGSVSEASELGLRNFFSHFGTSKNYNHLKKCFHSIHDKYSDVKKIKLNPTFLIKASI